MAQAQYTADALQMATALIANPSLTKSHNYARHMSFDLSKGAKSIIEDLSF